MNTRRGRGQLPIVPFGRPLLQLRHKVTPLEFDLTSGYINSTDLYSGDRTTGSYFPGIKAVFPTDCLFVHGLQVLAH